MLNTFRLGLRPLQRAPGFALLAVASLALGIGANSAVFSVMRALLYHSQPLPHPGRLVVPFTSADPGSQSGYGGSSMSWPVFEALGRQTRVFQTLVGFVPLGVPGTPVRARGVPAVANADMVSGNYFSGLGVGFATGRGFTPRDEKTRAQLAVIGYDFWTTRYGRNPNVLGSELDVRGVPFTIVGVAARGFDGFEPGHVTDVWIPFQDRPALPPWGHPGRTLQGNPQWWFLLTVGRLQPGVTIAQARAALAPVFARAAYATLTRPRTRAAQLTLRPAAGAQALNDPTPRFNLELEALMAMVGLVLLIACANVSLLLLAKHQARRQEFHLRLALGANAWHLARQLLAECAILVTAATALGWALAVWLTRMTAAWERLRFSLAPDAAALGFTMTVAVAVAVLMSLAPLRAVLTQRRRLAFNAGATRGAGRFGWVLATLQVALSLALVANAALLVRSLRNVENVRYGMRNQGLVVFGLSMPRAAGGGTHASVAAADAQRLAYFRSVVQQLRQVPGVAGVTLLQNRLGGGWSDNSGVTVDGVSPFGPHRLAPLRLNFVGADYFSVLQQPLLAGRGIAASDLSVPPVRTSAYEPTTVAVVNQYFVSQYLHGRPALGRLIGVFDMTARIVGVAADSQYTSAQEKPRPMAWLPYPGNFGTMQIEVRGTGATEALLARLRQAMLRIAPSQPMQQPMTQIAQWQSSYSDQTMMGRLAIFFGLLALMLVATGLYGTLAYRVSRRTAEVGVRMALGAGRARVLWMVLRESLALAAAGLLAGAPLAWMGARMLASVLFGVQPGEPVALLAAGAGLLLVALAAALAPALRAASVDPLRALRTE